MDRITYAILDENRFHEDSLDDFIRHQKVTETWQLVDGEYVLRPCEFEENWDLEKLREEARYMLLDMKEDAIIYGAFDGEKLVGFAQVNVALFGSTNQYAELLGFQVSEPYRNRGIGKELFHMAKDGAKLLGAKKLYISAHSSKESQAAYKHLGCVLAEEPDSKKVAEEPYDLQLECVL